MKYKQILAQSRNRSLLKKDLPSTESVVGFYRRLSPKIKRLNYIHRNTSEAIFEAVLANCSMSICLSIPKNSNTYVYFPSFVVCSNSGIQEYKENKKTIELLNSIHNTISKLFSPYTPDNEGILRH